MTTGEESNTRDGELAVCRRSCVSANLKTRVKMLKEDAHSQKLADAAVGLGTGNRRDPPAPDLNTNAMEDI